MLFRRLPAICTALLAGLSLLSCEPGKITRPSSLHPLHPAVAVDTARHLYTLVEGRPPLGSELQLGQLVGVAGGVLSLAGHTLTVPQGALSEPALVTLSLLPSGYVEVELTAVRTDALGSTVDVGGLGFARPVT